MGPDLEYLGPLDGGYHHFRDSSGQDYTLDGEDADAAMGEMSQSYSSPSTQQSPEPIVPLTGVLGIPGQAPTQSQSMPQLQGIPQEYGGAPPQQEQPRQRQRVRAPGASEETGPRQVGPNLWDNGDGTFSRVKQGSPGGMSPYTERGAGTAPDLIKDLVGAENDLHFRRSTDMLENEWLAREQRQSAVEKARADMVEAADRRQRAESRLSAIETERNNKWDEFSRRQEQIGKMKMNENAGENWATTILSALAVGAGAFAATTTGAPNFALSILNESKQRKMERQSFNINKAKGDLASERDEYDRYISSTLDGRKLEKQAAIEKEQMAAIDAMNADKALSSLAPEMRELRTQLEQQHNQTLAQLYSMYQVETTNKYQPGSAGGVETFVDPKLKRAGEVGKARKDARENEVDAGNAPVKWNGKTVGVIEKTEAKELNQTNRNFKQGYSVLEKVKRLQKKGKALSQQDRAELDALDFTAIQALRKPGMSSDSDFDRLSKAAGAKDWDMLLNSNYIKADTMQKLLLEEASSFAEQQLGDASYLSDWAKSYRSSDMDHQYNDPDAEMEE